METGERRVWLLWGAVPFALGVFLGGGIGWLGTALAWLLREWSGPDFVQVVAVVVAIVALVRNTRAHDRSYEQQRIANYLTAADAYYRVDETARVREEEATLAGKVVEQSPLDPERNTTYAQLLTMLEHDVSTRLCIRHIIEQQAPDLPAAMRREARHRVLTAMAPRTRTVKQWAELREGIPSSRRRGD